MRKALGKHAMRDEALKLPFVQGLVHVYHKLQGFRARRQHLALFAPFFPYKVNSNPNPSPNPNQNPNPRNCAKISEIGT